MDIEERLNAHFQSNIDVAALAAESLTAAISTASDKIVECLLQEGKILICGNGCCAANAQYFAAKMLNRFDRERPSLPAIALTSDSLTLTSIMTDYGHNEVFSKQIFALGQPNDVLLVLSTTGNSENSVEAVNAAHDRAMVIVALTGGDGGALASLLVSNDIEIRVPTAIPARVQEVQLLILNCICDLIDHHLFGE